MHDNCQPESSAAAADGVQLAVNALAEFPVRGGAGNMVGRIAAVAELCRAVDKAMDALVVRVAAEAAEEGWTTGRMREANAGYHQRLQQALAGPHRVTSAGAQR
ncbi:hypothetical protein OG455_04965 [Kitasatospora sp. NBC_01287]|uniref:hypothetical protein n=1 Tax=Kitasatospora sp. NBC_01287 TaxID=2903573 RepID=UPI00225A5A82|nr:hypothetical protein [Kitasatospora sp. NBC_01287]MCX4744877.1 hypothetical protein [Kitasatospora sp. NBC_01287]